MWHCPLVSFIGASVPVLRVRPKRCSWGFVCVGVYLCKSVFISSVWFDWSLIFLWTIWQIRLKILWVVCILDSFFFNICVWHLYSDGWTLLWRTYKAVTYPYKCKYISMYVYFWWLRILLIELKIYLIIGLKRLFHQHCYLYLSQIIIYHTSTTYIYFI